MPENKKQGFIFGVIMSYAMAFGMEIYNSAINLGFDLKAGGLSHMTNEVFVVAMKEVGWIGIVVIILSSLYGNKFGEHFMLTHTKEDDPAYFKVLMRQAGTVAVMCPSMSLFATVAFFMIPGVVPVSQLPAVFVGTLIKNFPMAFFWNMFGAAPFTRWAFSHAKRFLD